MDKQQIKTYFGTQHFDEIESLICNNGSMPAHIKFKNPKITLVLAIFLGFLGIDRLYQSGISVWLCKLAMLMFSLGTWWLIDIGYAIKMTQDINYKKLTASIGS